ncbi:chitin-binding protein [Serratia marcescens]|nr:chitin-binding protein [Serratia marcescens]
MRNSLSAIISLSFTSAILLGSSQFASAHGYVKHPSSRALQCAQQPYSPCGDWVRYNANGLEGPKGFPESGPPDGHIASAGLASFNALDQQSPTLWKKQSINSGELNLVWHLTAPHSTATWRYFITKTNWDPSQPLTRASFELVPFCQFNDGGAVPNNEVSHTCTIPNGYSGSHVILAVWDIANTANAFYQVIDVNIET